MNKLLVVGITSLLATGIAFGAIAQTPSATNEVATAHAHALMAQNAKTLAMAHAHLHHVVNCLVGPKGEGFDAKAENPCKGQGNGAIPDSASDAAMHGKLQSALSDAQAGLKADTLAAVQGDAGKAATALGAAPAPKASGGSSW